MPSVPVLPDPRELQEIVDQLLHGAARLLDAVHEVGAGIVQAVAVVLAQQAREAQQGHQRRAEVVGQGVHALLELVVATHELSLDTTLGADVTQ